MAGRIEMTDNAHMAADRLAGGCEPAMNVLLHVIYHSREIDSHPFHGSPFVILTALDAMGVYEGAIWRLHRDVCCRNFPKTLAVVRCWQAGWLTTKEIHDLIEGQSQPEKLAKLGRCFATLPKSDPNFKMWAVIDACNYEK